MSTRIRIAWLQFLDRVKPRPGIGGPSPRVEVITDPDVLERIEEIVKRRNGGWGRG